MQNELNKEQVEKIQRETIRAVLNMLSCEPADFFYSNGNDSGSVALTLYTEGDPKKLYLGKEDTARFRDGIRGTGSYKLNDAAVEMLLKRINEKD
jgi:hypothetical protein